MLPTELLDTAPAALRDRYRVVRLDSGIDLPGRIISASSITGLAFMELTNGSRQEFILGPGGLRIVPR